MSCFRTIQMGVRMLDNYVIAKYIRLSKDDAYSDSLSIQNQHLILDAHIEDLSLTDNITSINFVDNDYTGTNMDRPALQEMLELARGGGVNCIIVKDFSRFSRNILESGYYIEQVFPLYQIRFISVSDTYDSNDHMDNTGGLDIAFQFLKHEYYSQDLSKKIKSARRIQMARGEGKAGLPIYGYKKNDSGGLDIDEPAAKVVSEIFEMVKSGLPIATIKLKLFEAKYPTPREYIDIERGKEVVPSFVWGTTTLRRIIFNEQYVGTYVSGKIAHNGFGSGKRVYADEEDWIKIQNHHPAIISEGEFVEAQQIYNNHLRRKTAAVKLNETKKQSETTPQPVRTVAIATYGYSKVAKSMTGESQLEPDNDASKIVCMIFNWTLEGLGVLEIGNKLAELKIPTPLEYLRLEQGHDIKPKYKWPDRTIKKILTNTKYSGGIISVELFERVQKTLVERLKNKKPQDFLLRGKLKCGCCGKALAYSAQKIPKLYCNNKIRGLVSDCHEIKLLVSEVDDVVIGIIKKYAEIIMGTSEPAVAKKSGDKLLQVFECEERIKKLKKQNQTYYEQFVNKEIDRESYHLLKEDSSKQLEWLNNQLELHRQCGRAEREHEELATYAKDALNATTSSKDLVEALVEKVHIFPDYRMEIIWKVSGFGVGV